MTRFFVTEGPTDAALISKVLREIGYDGFDVRYAGGKNYVPSFARSLALYEDKPVMAVMDSDTMDPALVRKQELVFNDFVTSVALSSPLELALAIPNLEHAIGEESFIEQLTNFLEVDFLLKRQGFELRR
jgi:hypothetical protein